MIRMQFLCFTHYEELAKTGALIFKYSIQEGIFCIQQECVLGLCRRLDAHRSKTVSLIRSHVVNQTELYVPINGGLAT